MPKGNKYYKDITKYAYFCSEKNTERVFETEQQYETYLKRHAKMCSCKGIISAETECLFKDGNIEEIRNDISRK